MLPNKLFIVFALLLFVQPALSQMYDDCTEARRLPGKADVIANNEMNSPGLPIGSCNDPAVAVMQNTRWYDYRARDAGTGATAAITLTPLSDFDPIVALFTGECSDLQLVDCRHGPGQIRFEIPVDRTSRLYIVVGQQGPNPGGGEYRLQIRLGPEKSNDTCDDPFILTGSSPRVFMTNDFNTPSGPPTQCNDSQSSTMQNSQWFSYTAPQTGNLRIECDAETGFRALLGVFEGICKTPVEIGCGEGTNLIRLSVPVVIDQTLLMAVGNWGGMEEGGYYYLSVSWACEADVDFDNDVTPADFTAWLACFNNPASAPYCDRADVNDSGTIDPADFTAWLAAFNMGCP